MITSKDAASLWLEASAMFQTTLEEVMTEWGKPQEADAAALIKNVVSADPELQAFAQEDPDLSMVLEQQENKNASTAER